MAQNQCNMVHAMDLLSLLVLLHENISKANFQFVGSQFIQV